MRSFIASLLAIAAVSLKLKSKETTSGPPSGGASMMPATGPSDTMGFVHYMGPGSGSATSGPDPYATSFNSTIGQFEPSSWDNSTWGNSTWGNSSWDGNSTWGNSSWDGNSTWGNSTWGPPSHWENNSTWGNSTWGNSSWDGNSTWGNSSWDGNSTWGNSSWGNSSWGNSSWDGNSTDGSSFDGSASGPSDYRDPYEGLIDRDQANDDFWKCVNDLYAEWSVPKHNDDSFDWSSVDWYTLDRGFGLQCV